MHKIIKNIKSAMIKHSPEILTGIGITGMITTTVMAVRATPKALILIEEEKRSINYDILEAAKKNGDESCSKIEKLKPLDTIKVAWKCYIPATITGAISVVCLIGASSVNMRRNAALATAYTLSESALKEYQEKVIESIGNKKEQTIRDAVAKDKIEKSPIQNTEVIVTGKGETLCYDTISGRYFKSDIEKLRQVVNDLNLRMRDEMYISLNEFYYEIGMDNIKVGDDLGWNIDSGYIDLRYSSQLATDGTPCLVIDYSYGPRYDFRTLA